MLLRYTQSTLDICRLLDYVELVNSIYCHLITGGSKNLSGKGICLQADEDLQCYPFGQLHFQAEWWKETNHLQDDAQSAHWWRPPFTCFPKTEACSSIALVTAPSLVWNIITLEFFIFLFFIIRDNMVQKTETYSRLMYLLNKQTNPKLV